MLQVRVQQGKEPGHLLALFQGSMVIHKTLASLPPSASARSARDLEGASKGRSALKEPKGRGRLYAIAGNSPSRAYSVQVEASAASLNSNTCYLLYTPTGGVFLWLGHWTDMMIRSIANHVAQCQQQVFFSSFSLSYAHIYRANHVAQCQQQVCPYFFCFFPKLSPRRQQVCPYFFFSTQSNFAFVHRDLLHDILCFFRRRYA